MLEYSLLEGLNPSNPISRVLAAIINKFLRFVSSIDGYLMIKSLIFHCCFIYFIYINFIKENILKSFFIYESIYKYILMNYCLCKYFY